MKQRRPLSVALRPADTMPMSIGDEVGERGRNRTFNLLIKSQLLCQLSYAPASPLLATLSHGASRPVESNFHAHLEPAPQAWQRLVQLFRAPCRGGLADRRDGTINTQLKPNALSQELAAQAIAHGQQSKDEHQQGGRLGNRCAIVFRNQLHMGKVRFGALFGSERPYPSL